ncbi:MAG TPA: SGNH/GDSL hydrolase family protein, partial [Terrimicrobiaceae bacterium]|nr:SGNH/GDSL hydrolase family protein [Terrimicrobiaceae bacterium]
GLRWLDAFDRRLALRGLGWPAENLRRKNFFRAQSAAAGRVSDHVRLLARCPAGVHVAFFTDSAELSVRLEAADSLQMGHMPATGMAGAELYFREEGRWYPMATARPSVTEPKFEANLFRDSSRRLREYRLYLPLYKPLVALALGFERGAVVRPARAPRGSKPWIFYGTSITQGGCASTAGSDFVSMVGRALDAETINFGFSGNGKGEPAMARLIRQIDAEMYVLDFFANTDGQSLDSVLAEFLRILREKRPRTPVVILGMPALNQILWNEDVRTAWADKRDTAMRVYLRAKDAGDRHLHFIDGQAVLPAGIAGAYVDGVHPTSHGFALMAERLAPLLREILLGENLSVARRDAAGTRRRRKPRER